MRNAVADIVAARINAMDLKHPTVGKEKRLELERARRALKTDAGA